MTHCWKGYLDWLDECGLLGSEEWAAAYECDATCMLPDGHDGPHEFVRDDQIGIHFEESPN